MRSCSKGAGPFGGASAAYWAARRAAVLATVYPGGALTGFPDSATTPTGFALPAGCDHVIRYTVTNSGGRAGGTPSNVDVAFPAPWNKKVAFHLGGHGSGEEAWYDSRRACATDGSSFVLKLLANGWAVANSDLPGYGIQPIPQRIVVNGSLVEIPARTGHPYGWYWAYPAEPDANRLYYDHPILTMNQLTRDYGVTKFALIGHSGGADCAQLLAALDDRFQVVHILQQGGFESAGSGNDIENWQLGNPIFAAAGIDGQYYSKHLMQVAAAVPGRITVLAESATDEEVGNLPIALMTWQQWVAWQPVVNSLFAQGGGNAPQMLFYDKNTKTPHEAYQPDSYHMYDSVQSTWVVNHILANM